MVGGPNRGSYQHSRLACYTRITGPASARPVRPGTCVDWRLVPDDPIRGARPPLAPRCSSSWGRRLLLLLPPRMILSGAS